MQSNNEIKSIIKDWTNDRVANIHTCTPGKIISYNPKTNRADVQPVGEFKTNDERSLPYPIIHNAPIIFPTGNGGKSGITFPIKSGDGCLIVFSEGQLEDFLAGEKKSDSDDPRRHSLNDAIIIPGLYTNAVPTNIQHSGDVCVFNDIGLVRLNSNELTGEVAGTNFRFANGDLVVNGISLVHHKHSDVVKGGDLTGQPV